MTRQIQISDGSFVIVDAEDYENLIQWKWSAHVGGYASRAQIINGRRVFFLMHRYILGLEKGDMDVDHINGDRSDNRKRNLRLVTRKQNGYNRGVYSTSSSGYRGVYFRKDNNKWRAVINKDYKRYNIGSFDCKHEAAKAYNVKAKELYGEFARLNVIEEVLDERNKSA